MALLNEFTFSSGGGISLPGFKGLLTSLVYQAQTLGLKPQTMGESNCDNGLSFKLSHPSMTPIRCDIFGWSEDSLWPATEYTIQAGCGLMSVHGRASGKTQSLGVDYVSTLTASLSIQGMFAAAIGQLRGGNFSRVTTSMLQGGLLSVGQYLAGATATDEPESLLPGKADTSLRPPFVSADGVVFELETLFAEPWQRFWSQVGIDNGTAGQAWSAFLMRYAKAVSPLPEACMQALARLPMAKIRALAAESGISLSPVRSLSERMKDESFTAELQQGPWNFQTPLTGGKALTLLSSSSSLPLQGIKVIESCRRIQGPLAGHLLASLGAEVIRLELPGGDPLRAMSPSANGCSVRFDALNRLKQVREVDIKSVQGREEIEQMIREADVFLQNWASGKAAQLRLDYTDLARINPSLVYAYAGGWGKHNDEIQLTGTDFMVQAWSGVADLIGHHSRTRGGSLFTTLDVLGGVIAAQGVVAALLNREVKKQGANIESSLLGAANLLCTSQAFPDVRKHAPPEVDLIKGVYATEDGLMAIECQNEFQINLLANFLNLIFSTDILSRDRQLQTIFSTQSTNYWERKLNNLGISASIVTQKLSDLVTNSRLNSDICTNGYSAITTYWRFQ
ncbi:carnitine dehydratase [Salmonella enterica subsp. enterica serovar Newport]|nr:carnitine dehydratase [Salmonella enterica subsp. enterica serovar Newport]